MGFVEVCTISSSITSTRAPSFVIGQSPHPLTEDFVSACESRPNVWITPPPHRKKARKIKLCEVSPSLKSPIEDQLESLTGTSCYLGSQFRVRKVHYMHETTSLDWHTSGGLRWPMCSGTCIICMGNAHCSDEGRVGMHLHKTMRPWQIFLSLWESCRVPHSISHAIQGQPLQSPKVQYGQRREPLGRTTLSLFEPLDWG